MTPYTLPEPQKYGYIANGENLYTEAQMLQVRTDTIAEILEMWGAPYREVDGEPFIGRLRRLI